MASVSGAFRQAVWSAGHCDERHQELRAVGRGRERVHHVSGDEHHGESGLFRSPGGQRVIDAGKHGAPSFENAVDTGVGLRGS